MSPRRWVPVALFLTALAPTAGCGSGGVYLVQCDEHGGVVSLPNNSNVWPTYYRSQAEKLIAQCCPQGHVITKEEKVTTSGGDDSTNRSERYEYDGALVRVQDERSEYHITFHVAPPRKKARAHPRKPAPPPSRPVPDKDEDLTLPAPRKLTAPD